jgi:hypothetical protein
VDDAQMIPDPTADHSLPMLRRVEWFSPDRPVNGTVFVKPDEHADEFVEPR